MKASAPLWFAISMSCSAAPAAPSESPSIVVVPRVPASAAPASSIEEAAAAPPTVQPDAGFEVHDIGRYRDAVESYDPSIKAGSNVPQGVAIPFASYVNVMHGRIHKTFADGFLKTLDKLPPAHPLNGDLVTIVEIVVEGASGKIAKMGIVRASGITAYDVAVLDSVLRASPFGAAPKAILSWDGNVYVTWEFHRDPNVSCSSTNTKPSLLPRP